MVKLVDNRLVRSPNFGHNLCHISQWTHRGPSKTWSLVKSEDFAQTKIRSTSHDCIFVMHSLFDRGKKKSTFSQLRILRPSKTLSVLKMVLITVIAPRLTVLPFPLWSKRCGVTTHFNIIFGLDAYLDLLLLLNLSLKWFFHHSFLKQIQKIINSMSLAWE